MQIGLETAEADQICASVVASKEAEGLYLSCGFQPVGWITEGDNNPMRHLPGGRILFRDVY